MSAAERPATSASSNQSRIQTLISPWKAHISKRRGDCGGGGLRRPSRGRTICYAVSAGVLLVVVGLVVGLVVHFTRHVSANHSDCPNCPGKQTGFPSIPFPPCRSHERMSACARLTDPCVVCQPTRVQHGHISGHFALST